MNSILIFVLLPCLTAAENARQVSVGASVLGEPVEVDPESGAKIYLLGADERPADNIYGEQPFSDASSRRIALRYYATKDKPGGLNVFDLYDGSNHEIVAGRPSFPAFHAWGEYLYTKGVKDGQLMLRRYNYLTLEMENVIALPAELGEFSYGTVSPDHRYYAASVRKKGEYERVYCVDLETGVWSVLCDMPGYHPKHEQFSRDGRNRVLIQLNQLPDVKMVLLGELRIGGEPRMFPADRPHTPRPTGHEAWIGSTGRIVYSTGKDPDGEGNLWVCSVDDQTSVPAARTPKRMAHVSASACGKYWLGDATGEEGVPIYIGSLETGNLKRAVFSRTKHDGKQWSHTHMYLTADNKWLIFTSTRNGHPQVYGACLAEGWLDAL
jgi:hypothetical protein